jgi:hypothetical protein
MVLWGVSHQGVTPLHFFKKKKKKKKKKKRGKNMPEINKEGGKRGGFTT